MIRIMCKKYRQTLTSRALRSGALIGLLLLMAALAGCAPKKSGDVAVSESDTHVAYATAYPKAPSCVPEICEQDEEETPVATEAPTPAPTPEPTATPQPLSVSLIMTGDVLLHTPVEQSCKREDGSYDYRSLFADTKDLISAADLALVNQEVIIGGEDLGISGYPGFNAAFSLCDALTDAGFDVICHATNHAMDKGRKGLVNCAENWEEHYPDITVLGIHADPSTSTSGGAEPFVYTVSNAQESLSVAILNYTYGTNGISLPEGMPYAVDLLDADKVTADIQRAKELADFVIVCPHWGTEYRLTPDSMQKKWTDLFLENGVDLVLGTHPHVIEPVELVRDEETGHEMLVYYSLGNFVNWTSGTGKDVANRMVGGMAQVTVTLNEDGAAVISDYGVIALVCHLQKGPEGVSVLPLSSYNSELGDSNAIRSQDPAFSYDYCVELCDKVWGDLWK